MSLIIFVLKDICCLNIYVWVYQITLTFEITCTFLIFCFVNEMKILHCIKELSPINLIRRRHNFIFAIIKKFITMSYIIINWFRDIFTFSLQGEVRFPILEAGLPDRVTFSTKKCLLVLWIKNKKFSNTRFSTVDITLLIVFPHFKSF